MAGERKNRPLRLDPALDAALEKAARMNLRSVNAEITVILRRAMIEAGILKDPAQGMEED
jgi:hypothetical protein